jgi:BirA family biotin operon repressor/biotin-[acetyl-CoA-carboxylase] ligase
VGVGLNVNQTNWTAAFARPATSLRKEKGADFELDAVRTQWLRNLAYYYTRLQAGQLDWLHSRYQSVLYRLGLPTAFADQSGSPFTATALGTTTEGFLRVKTNGVERHFPFKEIQFLQ